jgi:hypothetical protein
VPFRLNALDTGVLHNITIQSQMSHEIFQLLSQVLIRSLLPTKLARLTLMLNDLGWSASANSKENVMHLHNDHSLSNVLLSLSDQFPLIVSNPEPLFRTVVQSLAVLIVTTLMLALDTLTIDTQMSYDRHATRNSS